MMKTLNVGIFAHIDAGKTSLTERMLLIGGALRTFGRVDDGASATDFLPVERRRGISVRDATVTFRYRDVTINLIDTPGHADFFEETELALTAIDACVIVVSAREGVEAQTEQLLEAVRQKNIPSVFFLNKCDMTGVICEPIVQKLRQSVAGEILPMNNFADSSYERAAVFENAVEALGDEDLLERYLSNSLSAEELRQKLTEAVSQAKVFPLLYGSAKTGEGVEQLLDTLCRYFRFKRDGDAPFSAYVYQVEHRKNEGKIAHIRLFGGTLGIREEVFNRRTGSIFKATQIKLIKGAKYADANCLTDGEIGAVAGLADVRAGDFLGAELPFRPLRLFDPYLRVKVLPENAEELTALKTALEELTDESPSYALEWVPEKRELTVAAAGSVQTEVLKETLFERYGLRVVVGEPSVIYRETPARAAFGYEHYTMPKPCWAVVKFYIEPLPHNCGLVYNSVVSDKKIAYRYQQHIETEVPRALSQGLKGWQVTDLKVTLVDGEDHPQHTHPLDFFVATPMGIMDGLRNCGTVLLEPVLEITIRAPEQAMGKIIGEITARRAEPLPPLCENGAFTLSARIPAAETFGLTETIASLSGGRANYHARLLGYFPCPDGKGQIRERTGIDPLNRAQWILHARGAYKV